MSSFVYFDKELGAPFIQKYETDKEYFSSFRLFCSSWLFKNFQLESYLFTHQATVAGFFIKLLIALSEHCNNDRACFSILCLFDMRINNKTF